MPDKTCDQKCEPKCQATEEALRAIKCLEEKLCEHVKCGLKIKAIESDHKCCHSEKGQHHELCLSICLGCE